MFSGGVPMEFCIRVPKSLLKRIYGVGHLTHEVAQDLYRRLAKTFNMFREGYTLTSELEYPGNYFSIKQWLPGPTGPSLRTVGSVEDLDQSVMVCIREEQTY